MSFYALALAYYHNIYITIMLRGYDIILSTVKCTSMISYFIHVKLSIFRVKLPTFFYGHHMRHKICTCGNKKRESEAEWKREREKRERERYREGERETIPVSR